MCYGAEEKPNDKFYFNKNERHIFYHKKITKLNFDQNKEIINEKIENREEINKVIDSQNKKNEIK